MAIDIGKGTEQAITRIDVAELPERLDAVITNVHDYFRTIDVVRDGHVIAQITPPPLKITTTPPDQVGKRKVVVTPEERERFKRLDAELRARLHELAPEPFDAVEEIREQRSRDDRW